MPVPVESNVTMKSPLEIIDPLQKGYSTAETKHHMQSVPSNSYDFSNRQFVKVLENVTIIKRIRVLIINFLSNIKPSFRGVCCF